MPRITTRLPIARQVVCLLVLCGLFQVFVLGGCGFVRERPAAASEDEKELDPTELVALEPGSGYFQTWEMDNGRLVSFVVSVPTEYTPGTPTPLVVALHFGMPRAKQFMGREMVGRMVQPCTDDLKPIIVAPDYINTSWTNEECEQAVIGLVHKICETYNVDRQRILILGYSSGATGVWHLAGRHPDLFTAAIALAGRPTDDYLETNWSVPMLVIHSRSDEVFPFADVTQAVQQMRARVGGIIQLYELDAISHYESAKFIEPLKEAVEWVQEVWNSNAAADGDTQDD